MNSRRSDLPVAIVGGGVSGLAVAYELTQNNTPFTLFESTGRLGGIVETVHAHDFIIEGGPDGWVTEKPWARDLVVELGLEDQILSSNDHLRRTYIVRESKDSPNLVPLPDGMRMMVPLKWPGLLSSPLFSWRARLAYLREPGRAKELKARAPNEDESIAEFVCRHFGEEVMHRVAGPLLSGVFGGDIRSLSVRAVMPAFVKMEAEYGSLVAALRRRKSHLTPLFSTLATGMQTLVDKLAQRLPAASLRLHRQVVGIRSEDDAWHVLTSGDEERFQAIVLATPAHVTRRLLAGLGDEGGGMASLLPQEASSAVIVSLAFSASQSSGIRIPKGFGFLSEAYSSHEEDPKSSRTKLLAGTFVHQKFAHRAPPGAILLRAFFGGPLAKELVEEPDESLARLGREELSRILGPLPAPTEILVRRLPLSLPQYAVGHVERIVQLESAVKQRRGLHLVGNAYHGVGLPDLIRDGRAVGRALALG